MRIKQGSQGHRPRKRSTCGVWFWKILVCKSSRIAIDALLNIPGVTVEVCSYQDQEVYLTLGLLTDSCVYPHCQNHTQQIHQNRPILIRD